MNIQSSCPVLLKIVFTLCIGICLIIYGKPVHAQGPGSNILYIVDSIPVINDPEYGNEIVETDVADLTVVKNRDSLAKIGYDKFDGVIYIFTKEYRNRPDSLKKYPSLGGMQMKAGVWYYHEKPYSGKIIDYYYSGRKQEEAVLHEGQADGLRLMYYQNGHLSSEKFYTKGVANGLEKEYYEDGSLRQQGAYKDGKEEGAWEIYYPNGQIKQAANFQAGEMIDSVTMYYSSGKILARQTITKGKVVADEKMKKLVQALNKGHQSNSEENYKKAIKDYTKALEMDTTYAETYFARGTARLNDFQFDEAILDFDRALAIEPYLEKALANRAFTRIRKYQLGSSRTLSDHNGVKVMAGKDHPDIPENERAIICQDLQQAIFLGDDDKMITDAYQEFCKQAINE